MNRMTLSRSKSLLLLAPAIAVLACSSHGAGDGSSPTLVTSQQALCAGAAPEYAYGTERYATSAACPFEQQLDNIVKFGSALPAAANVYDASGAKIGAASNGCDHWLIATDPRGVTVIVDRDSGELRSHGNVHPGQPVSTVVSPLPLPLTVK